MISHTHNGIDEVKVKKGDVIGDVPDGSTAVRKKETQTVAGIKTFSTTPVSTETPSSNNGLVNKKYVDDTEATLPNWSVKACDSVVDEANTSESTSNTSPFKKKEFKFNEKDGRIRTKFYLQSSNGDEYARAQIYINGVAVGTARATKDTGSDPELDWAKFTEDIDVDKDDLIQLYIWRDDDGYGSTAICKNFTLRYCDNLDITNATVNID